MQGIRSMKKTVFFQAIFITLICMLFLSLFSCVFDGLLMQDIQTTDINLDLFIPYGFGKLHRYPLAYIFIQQAFFYQDAQRLLNSKNNSFMTSFYGCAYGLFIHTTPGFIFISNQASTYRNISFLLSLYCPNAPPVFIS